MIKTFLVLTFISIAMAAPAVVSAQAETLRFFCGSADYTGSSAFTNPSHTRGQLFTVAETYAPTEVAMAVYRTASVSQGFRYQLYEYTTDPPDTSNRTLLWESAYLVTDTVAPLSPTLPDYFTSIGSWPAVSLSGVTLDAGTIYGLHFQDELNLAESGFIGRNLNAGDVCSDKGIIPLSSGAYNDDQRYAAALWGIGAVEIDPTPTPHYDAPAMIDGLVGGGSEEDIGVGLIGGGVGLVAVAVVGALVGTGALLLATGGVLALVLLVTLGVIPTWTLVVILPVLLVAAYIRYALGNSS